MYDVKISGGRVVDGTGTPARHADVGVRDGRIVAIGRADEDARQEIDARGKVVAPGFIDVHTHYDAMVFWNGSLSPSSCHGITTVVGGNCGFSIAPLSPEASDYLMRMLARVEGMPLESLREGVPWDWSSFGEYLDRLEGQLAINAGFLVGHSAIRRVVMGERAVGHEATPDELARMVDLLRVSCEEGGLGFSSSLSSTHNDGESQPVPSRHASREELIALARAIRDVAGTTLELIPDFEGSPEESRRLMTDLSLAANRPLNWNALFVDASTGDTVADGLANSDYARERGAEVVAMTVPQAASFRINLHSGFVFDILHGWPDFFRLPVSERMERLRDPDYRQQLDTNARERSGEASELAHWERLTVCETFSEANERYGGKTLGEVARLLGVTPFDALCELALADGLQTQFLM